MQVGQGEEVSLTLRADDRAFRDFLRSAAAAAVATDPAQGLNAGEATRLVGVAAATRPANVDAFSS